MNIYILGAGSMAREVLTYYKQCKMDENVKGFIEEDSKRADALINGKTIFDAEIIKELSKKETLFLGAIGTPLRKRWIEALEDMKFEFDTLLHPSAIIGDFIQIGMGTIISPNIVMTTNVKVGKHTIINIGTTINHDCIIGDYVTIGPGVSIAGKVKIGDMSWIGIGTKIINDIKIGKNSFIGAGAVVVKDIPDNVLALGIPAKPVRTLSEEDWKNLI